MKLDSGILGIDGYVIMAVVNGIITASLNKKQKGGT